MFQNVPYKVYFVTCFHPKLRFLKPDHIYLCSKIKFSFYRLRTIFQRMHDKTDLKDSDIK